MSPVRAIRLLCIIGLCATPGAVRGQDAVPTMDEIVAAARQRQEAVKSARFEWTVERWMKQGANDMVGSRFHMQSPGPNPPKDSETKIERSLILSDGKLRYENFGPDFNVSTPFRLITTWNGEKSSNFQDADEVLTARVGREPWFQYLDTIMPIGWTYRMLDRNWARLTLREFIIRPNYEQQGGELCVVLELSKSRQPHPERPLVKRLWLSRDRGFVVRRFQSGTGTTVFTQIDIDYSNSSEGIVVPVRWTKVKGDISDPRIIDECKVTMHELNIDVDEDAFQLELPPNTWVEEEGVADPYIVRDDGSNRTITKSERQRGATMQEIVATASGQAPSPALSANESVKWFWVVQGILAIVVAAVWFKTRRIRS